MRRTSRLQAVRRTAAASVAVLALGGLTACNDDAPTATDDPSETSSASESESEEPEGPTAGETVDPASFVEDVLAGLDDATSAHMTMQMQGGPAEMTMEGDVDYTTETPEMAMTMTSAMFGKGGVEVVMVDGVMYMQIPQLGRGKWMKVPLTGPNAPLSDEMMDQMDPGRMLELVEDGIDEVTYVGEEDVDGEALDHYAITVRSQVFDDLVDGLGGTAGVDLPTAITYDIWTDADGLMRKSEVAMGDLGSVTVTMSEWGEPVDIEAPPAEDVIKMPDGMSTMS